MMTTPKSPLFIAVMIFPFSVGPIKTNNISVKVVVIAFAKKIDMCEKMKTNINKMLKLLVWNLNANQKETK